MPQFENLVFEGGGVKGIAYAGAIDVLEKKGVLKDIRRVAGTSAGAITACLLAMGADAAKAREIVVATPFADFEDSGSLGIVSDIWRLLHRYGWYKGAVFARWMKKQVAALAGDVELDFKTLAEWTAKESGTYRELYVVGTDLSAQRAKVYCAETTPDMHVWEAVRISMSLPLFFATVKHAGDLWVDGGLTWNYPIDLFDRVRYINGVKGAPDDKRYNEATLGLRVDTRREISAERERFGLPSIKIDSLIDYVKALVGFTIDMANHAHLEKEDWQRSVFIESHGVSSTDFNLSAQQISLLVESGRLGAEAYFEWLGGEHKDRSMTLE